MMFLVTVCTALLTVGAALECEVCYTLNSKSCSGHYETCESSKGDDRCMVTLTETSVGSLKSALLEKSCGSAYKCTHPSSMTAKGYQVSVITKCCDTDYCNNGTMDLKITNATLNGVACPSCFAKDYESCDPEATVNCTGDENQCITFTASRHRGSTIKLAGCASASMERSQGRAAFQGSSVDISGFKYSNRGEYLHCSPLLPPLVLIVIVKILLL
ncbi:phospholipase A2 inhibitor and Ly6/PLAUR domain-containing protein-like [Discoglossus pictus]